MTSASAAWRRCRTPVTFNYLGQFDQSFASDALFRPLDEPAVQPTIRRRRCPTAEHRQPGVWR
jgi:hypothetical protein